MTARLGKFMAIMKHSPIRNYGGIPGLTSWLIGAPSEHGMVRLMECSRAHQEPIIPHSHRFNFHCLVLSGQVRNVIWTRMQFSGDEFRQSTLEYDGTPGAYRREAGEIARWASNSSFYQAGQEYSMLASEVHSIYFERGTAVLFFEGPATFDTSIILEPFVDGDVVPTFKVEPWAFKREAVANAVPADDPAIARCRP